jgi:undecaprenyl diphosphate synthase
VENLFALLTQYLDSEVAELLQEGVRLKGVGDLKRLPQEVLTALAQAEELTAHNKGITLSLALSYGSRAELTAATRDLAIKVKAGEIAPSDINEDLLAQSLWTGTLPDVDLLIRTGGEKRISNFLLWRIAYAELYFTETLWPDFGEEDLKAAIADFHSRQRRYGRTI